MQSTIRRVIVLLTNTDNVWKKIDEHILCMVIVISILSYFINIVGSENEYGFTHFDNKC